MILQTLTKIGLLGAVLLVPLTAFGEWETVGIDGDDIALQDIKACEFRIKVHLGDSRRRWDPVSYDDTRYFPVTEIEERKAGDYHPQQIFRSAMEYRTLEALANTPLFSPWPRYPKPADGFATLRDYLKIYTNLLIRPLFSTLSFQVEGKNTYTATATLGSKYVDLMTGEVKSKYFPTQSRERISLERKCTAPSIANGKILQRAPFGHFAR